MVFRKAVRVEKEKLDKYGRTIGKVFVDGAVDVSGMLAAKGHAWGYRKYARDQSLYDAGKLAKSKKLGIRSLPKDQQIPPWAWRKKIRTIGSQQCVQRELTAFCNRNKLKIITN